MSRLWVRHVCIGAIASALFAVLLLPGCGNDSKIVRISASSSVNSDAHEATISVEDVVYGNALVGVVLTYPDGSERMVMSGNDSGAGSSSVTLSDLPSGDYSYRVYATPAGPDDWPSTPMGRMVAEANVVASGIFTIQ
jgi:hypothetical protein